MCVECAEKRGRKMDEASMLIHSAIEYEENCSDPIRWEGAENDNE